MDEKEDTLECLKVMTIRIDIMSKRVENLESIVKTLMKRMIDVSCEAG